MEFKFKFKREKERERDYGKTIKRGASNLGFGLRMAMNDQLQSIMLARKRLCTSLLLL